MVEHVFHGKTEEEIEAQFLMWQKANPKLVPDVRRHPIEELQLSMWRLGFARVPAEAPNKFKMVIEYKVKSGRRSRPRKRK